MHLKERIRRYPLTEQLVKSILREKIEKIELKPFFSSGYLTPTRREKYIISINCLKPEEEQKLTLIHEIAHIYYHDFQNCNTLSEELEVERLLEEETKKFYRQNKDLVDEVYILSLKT